MKNLGPKLKKARMARKWTQQQLADAVGAHRVYIAHCEDGRKVPSLQMLSKLADALNVKITRLLS